MKDFLGFKYTNGIWLKYTNGHLHFIMKLSKNGEFIIKNIISNSECRIKSVGDLLDFVKKCERDFIIKLLTEFK